MHRNYQTGWLLSIYADEKEGIVLWLLGEDGIRRRLTQSFPSVFYIRGELGTLRKIHHYLKQNTLQRRSYLTEKTDLFEGLQQVLAIETTNPVSQSRLFYNLKRRFKGLGVRYFNTGIPLSVSYAVKYGVFPTAHCFFSFDDAGNLLDIYPLDSPWDIEYSLPGLRTMMIEPDTEPQYSRPNSLQITLGEEERELKLDRPVQALKEFSALLETYDPDMLLAYRGDGWLFPMLLGWAQQYDIPFNPNRDKQRQPRSKAEFTFESYGVVHYRAQQTFLFGRWHIDPGNVTAKGFSICSSLELARITALPVQIAARNSPGAGFTAAQVAEALRRDTLVPEHKYQTEEYKSAAELNAADNGSLNYRPVIGLHHNVASIDFFMMYPSLMARHNISGETVGKRGETNHFIPETNVPITQDYEGLVPAVLKPIIRKRLVLKHLMAEMWEDDRRYSRLHDMADALKWLGYVSFGYQGFKHNLFGCIQAHEAITAYGREMLTRAKEAALDLGYSVLAANTDSLFVRRQGCSRKEDYLPLITEIEKRTGLTMMPEAIFNWIAFYRSKTNPGIGATNRYFGRMTNGKGRVRGLAQRRGDTPAWVVQGQIEIIRLLVREADPQKLDKMLPEAVNLMRQFIDDLYDGKVPTSDLIVTKRLSREVDRFKAVSEPGTAAKQLMARNRPVRVGQMIEFVYVNGGRPGVQAVDYRNLPSHKRINKQRYCELMMRAIYELISPIGVQEKDMYALARDELRQLSLFGG
jgi:DNA polymerase-2